LIAGDPERAEIAFFEAAADIGILPGLHDRRFAVWNLECLLPKYPFAEWMILFLFLREIKPAFNSCHGVLPPNSL
jgi:hypothetical protein